MPPLPAPLKRLLALGSLVLLCLLASAQAQASTETFTYDHAGNLIRHVDANGITLTRAYDALNRETSRTYAGNSDGLQAVETAYDPNNNVVQTTERISGHSCETLHRLGF